MSHHTSLCPFGMMPDGEPVSIIALDNGFIRCKVLTYGATLHSLLVPDQNGDPVDVVLGYDTLREYIENDGYLGATVGRFANRIAEARFSLNGKEFPLATNDGPNHLHGGLTGFSQRVWAVDWCTTDAVTLSLFSKDGEEGYPGNLQVKVTYKLCDNGLTICYYAVSDADTPCNLTNHSYFNLSGHDSGSVLDQTIRIFAQYYTPTNSESIPLGIVAPVENTPMDLRNPIRIGEHIDDDFLQLAQGHGYDHNFVVDGAANTLRPAAVAYSEKTGITMQVHTTKPGIQFYTANFLADGRCGKDKYSYGPRHAFCLETQYFPDSPNQPQFPTAILKKDAEYQHMTVFSFSTNQ